MYNLWCSTPIHKLRTRAAHKFWHWGKLRVDSKFAHKIIIMFHWKARNLISFIFDVIDNTMSRFPTNASFLMLLSMVLRGTAIHWSAAIYSVCSIQWNLIRDTSLQGRQMFVQFWYFSIYVKQPLNKGHLYQKTSLLVPMVSLIYRRVPLYNYFKFAIVFD